MAGLRTGGPSTMGQENTFTPYDGPIRPHPGTRRPTTPLPGPLGPNPPGPQVPGSQPPQPKPHGDPYAPKPQTPGVPPTIGGSMPPTTPTIPTMPTTPTMPTGGGFQPTSLPVTGGGFGGGSGGYGGGPSSPVTPNINDQSQPNDNFTGGYGTGGGFGGTGGGGGYGTGGGNRTFGTGPTSNTWNIAGNTSITKGDEYAQKKPEKTFRKPKIAMGQKEIGDPRLAMQQLSAMQQTPFMRRA